MPIPEYDDRLRKVRIQLILQIPDGCRQDIVKQLEPPETEAGSKFLWGANISWRFQSWIVLLGSSLDDFWINL